MGIKKFIERVGMVLRFDPRPKGLVAKARLLVWEDSLKVSIL